MTRRFVVVGDPVAQSASPKMHAAAYAALGIDAMYERERVDSAGLAEVVARLRAGALDGVNVTLPHKGQVLEHVDVIEESAKVAAAANTLVRDEGRRIVAHNTDVAALADELRSLLGTAEITAKLPSRGLILGTGATARSALVALARDLRFTHVTVRGRAFASDNEASLFRRSAEDLLERAGARCSLTLEPWAPSSGCERQTVIVVQATTVGMKGGDAGEIAVGAVAWESLRPGAVALDVVYGDVVTPFVAAARARGLRAEGGLGMLARQGALAFELWHGVRAPLDVMRAALGST